MFVQPRIGIQQLAGLCRRLAIASQAGIDVRTMWRREGARASGSLQSEFGRVGEAVAGGESLADAVHRGGEFFPSLFREMVDVGERTGKLTEVFERLADHYEHQLAVRRTFFAGISWPLVQLSIALTVVGVMIWVMGFVAPPGDRPQIDPWGFGLVGTSGLFMYLVVVAVCATALLLLIGAMRRGILWARSFQRLAIGIPVVGRFLEIFAYARMTLVLRLTLDVEMDLRRVLTLALQSTGNDYYRRHILQVTSDLCQGRPICDTLRRSHAFSDDFLDVVEVAEESGQLVESMERLSRQYQEQSERALVTLAVLASCAVWGLVALLILALVFRIFMVYLGTIYDALDMTR